MKEQKTPDQIISEYTTTYKRPTGLVFNLFYYLGGLMIFSILLGIVIIVLGAGIALWKYILGW